MREGACHAEFAPKLSYLGGGFLKNLIYEVCQRQVTVCFEMNLNLFHLGLKISTNVQI